MTDNQIRTALEEASQGIIEYDVDLWFYWSNGKFYVCKDNDPLEDLNAMHEAEKLLDDDPWLEYMLNLMDVCRRHTDLGKWKCVQVCMSATARQRAEAYLKTLNLWKN